RVMELIANRQSLIAASERSDHDPLTLCDVLYNRLAVHYRAVDAAGQSRADPGSHPAPGTTAECNGLGDPARDRRAVLGAGRAPGAPPTRPADHAPDPRRADRRAAAAAGRGRQSAAAWGA